MRGPVLLLTAVLSLLGASPCVAMTLTLDDGTPSPQPYQGWLDAAKVPLPTNDVVLHLSSCPQRPTRTACAVRGEIWLDPEEDMTPKATFLHEVGHEFDYTVMTDAAREAVQFLRNDRRAWREGPNAPNERFAEAWMHCALQSSIRHRWENSAYDYKPSPAVHRMMCRLIWWAAAGDFG